MFSHIFFDLDGTLTDPALGITNSFSHALKEMGREIPSYATFCSFIGPPIKESFASLGFSKKETEEGIKKYREYFSTKGLFENKVYEGIPKLLAELKAAGKKLVVATSKPEVFSIQIADHFGFAQYFDAICGSTMDQTRSTKASVIEYALERNKIQDKSQVLMVGDREHDILGAKQNGLKSCGVLFGYGTRQELENAGANFIAKDISELKSICLSD
ncbi:MAG: HAD family hydrolase [Treponema sp.]|nr:HAD family hydrolase [Treponema sp.]